MKEHMRGNGSLMKISDMSDNHLVNTIRLIQRRAQEGVVIRMGGGDTAEEYWYDEETLYGENALDEMNFQDYLREARKRGLRE